MRQRVLIAMAISCRPSLLIADEPTTALDVTIQAQIIALLNSLAEETGTAILLVTHDLGLVARFAQKVAVMYAGRLVETAPVREIFAKPQHPYTRGLLGSVPPLTGPRLARLTQIEGSPPDLRDAGEGCAFAPRCPDVIARCSTTNASLTVRGAGHAAACWVPPNTSQSRRPPVARPGGNDRYQREEEVMVGHHGS
jgi:oligopeptide/dipeptide ABC transporter ATP-binding protein